MPSASTRLLLALDRNWVAASADIGRCEIFIGPVDEAIPAQQQAIRLSPRDPWIAIWYFRIGQAHLIQSRIDEAIGWLERAGAANPAPAFFHAYLASACAFSSDSRRAAAELGEVRRLDVAGRLTTIDGYRRRFEFALPEIRGRVEATFFKGLREPACLARPFYDDGAKRPFKVKWVVRPVPRTTGIDTMRLLLTAERTSLYASKGRCSASDTRTRTPAESDLHRRWDLIHWASPYFTATAFRVVQAGHRRNADPELAKSGGGSARSP